MGNWVYWAAFAVAAVVLATAAVLWIDDRRQEKRRAARKVEREAFAGGEYLAKWARGDEAVSRQLDHVGARLGGQADA